MEFEIGELPTPERLRAGSNASGRFRAGSNASGHSASSIEAAVLIGAQMYDSSTASTPKGARTALALPDTDGAPSHPAASMERAVTFAMVASGALYSFAGGLLYRLSPKWDESGANSILADLWMTYCLTMGVFVFCAIGSGISQTNRQALYSRIIEKKGFLLLLMAPSVMDVVITSMATLALAFIQPALASILKAAVQLVALTVASKLVLKKKQTWAQWRCIYAIVAGVVILMVNVLVYKSSSGTPGGNEIANELVGILIAFAALGCLEHGATWWSRPSCRTTTFRPRRSCSQSRLFQPPSSSLSE